MSVKMKCRLYKIHEHKDKLIDMTGFDTDFTVDIGDPFNELNKSVEMAKGTYTFQEHYVETEPDKNHISHGFTIAFQMKNISNDYMNSKPIDIARHIGNMNSVSGQATFKCYNNDFIKAYTSNYCNNGKCEIYGIKDPECGKYVFLNIVFSKIDEYISIEEGEKGWKYSNYMETS